MHTPPTAAQITDFTTHYIAAGLTLAEEEIGDASREDIAEPDAAHIATDCAAFIAAAVAADLLSIDSDMQQAGTDYWLTRNGAGTGYWTRPEVYGETEAEALSELARKAGPADFERGDDGQVYRYPPVSFLTAQ